MLQGDKFILCFLGKGSCFLEGFCGIIREVLLPAADFGISIEDPVECRGERIKVHIQFLQDAPDVVFHRILCDEQAGRDLTV